MRSSVSSSGPRFRAGGLRSPCSRWQSPQPQLSVGTVKLLASSCGRVKGWRGAFPVAQLGIPSFVASLAGWLIYRGALLVITAGTGTIIIADQTFNAIGNGFDFGDSARGLVRGPGQHNADLSISKQATMKGVGEAARLEFRASIREARRGSPRLVGSA